jgi:hypothetical protein
MICEKCGHNRCESCWYSKQAEVEALLVVQLEEDKVKEAKRQKYVPSSGFSIAPLRLRRPQPAWSIALTRPAICIGMARMGVRIHSLSLGLWIKQR